MTAVLTSNSKENLQKVLDFAAKIGVVISLPKKPIASKSECIAKITWNNKPTRKNNSTKKNIPVFGCAKGKMWFADDFDAPLEGFEEYM